MAQVTRSPKTYDVCIIGSGAGGGMAAKILTEGGLSVALLEAGPQVYPEKEFKMFMWPYELPHRGAGVGGTALENFASFWRPMGRGTSPASHTLRRPVRIFSGSARVLWAGARIIGGTSRCALLQWIFVRTRETHSEPTRSEEHT